ncbi:hypothetical protein [Runella limosa]|uniref:hypothetical protein n=1 Tax=Runella limosa TaxID=370978 RepID=UPI0003FA021F|nr:hypothetical protein [Runella limosa]
MTTEQKLAIVKTHFATCSNVLGSEDKAAEFIAWITDFFTKNPKVLVEISNPKTRDKVFATAMGMMNNPLLGKLF